VNLLLLAKTCLPDRQAPTAANLVSHFAVSTVADVFTGNFVLCEIQKVILDSFVNGFMAIQ